MKFKTKTETILVAARVSKSDYKKLKAANVVISSVIQDAITAAAKSVEK